MVDEGAAWRIRARRVAVFAVLIAAVAGLYTAVREGSRIWLRPSEPIGLSVTVSRAQAAQIASRAPASSDREAQRTVLREALGDVTPAEIDAAHAELPRIIDYGRMVRQIGRRAAWLAWVAVAMLTIVGIRRTQTMWWLGFALLIPLSGWVVVVVVMWGWARRCPWVEPQGRWVGAEAGRAG